MSRPEEQGWQGTAPLVERLRFTAEHGLFKSVDAGMHASYVEAADAVDELLEAMVAAKREMWMIARDQWTMADFKNWAVIQQIDAALVKARGQ